jgi:sugar/nucleoside kinase (ribokinase family)
MSRGENFLGVFGHTNLDFIMDVESMPRPDSSTQVTNVRRYFGGTGANIAMLASAMGVKSSLASFVGKDFPGDFRSALVGAGVDISDLVEVVGYMTPTCRILNGPEGSQMCIMDQGPMGVMDDFKVARHTIESSEIVHIGTGRPAYYKRVMSAASKAGKRIHFDPGQELGYVYTKKDFADMLAMSDLLFANQHELSIAMKYLGIRKAEKLLDRVGILVVTYGKDGSIIMTPAGETYIPARKPRKFVDPTGAGDAYRAGFYAGLSRGLDLESCGKLGAAAASFAIEVRGPVGSLPGWEEVSQRAGL